MSERAAPFYYVARLEGGEATAVDLTDRVEQFKFVDREKGADKLTLTVNNDKLQNFDDPVFERGAKLRVAFGNGLATSPVRDMVIRKVTGSRTLTVEAITKEGALMDTVKRRRRFENVRRSDVVRTISKEVGFTDPDIEDTADVFPSIAQGNMTDAQFLRKLAHLEGFEFYIDAFGLHWHRRRVDQAPVRSYIYFLDPVEGEILDFNVENDVTRRPGKVTVKGRNPITKTDIEAVASNDDDTNRTTLAPFAVAIAGEDGRLIDASEVAVETTVTSNVATQTDADAEAKGKFRKASQMAVKLNLQLRGDPALQAKCVIECGGLGARLSGKYYVREVEHTLDAGGGYDMTAKTITDGFQGGGRKPGTAEDGGALLNTVANELVAASFSDFSSSVDGETGALAPNLSQRESVVGQADALASALRALGSQSGDQKAKNALRASAALKGLASAARRAGMPNTAAAAANAAAVCQRIASAPEQIEAKGKQNTKGVNDSTVRPVSTVDADGRPVTRYQTTGGRET